MGTSDSFTRQQHRRSKILATVGPASSSPVTLTALVEAGVDAFRVNASHITPSEVFQTVSTLRAHLRSISSLVPVVVDVQGPKLRLERLDQPMNITPGVRLPVSFSSSAVRDAFSVPFAFDPYEVGLEEGHRVLFADGRVEAVVVSMANNRCELLFPVGGVLESRKGVNLPDTAVMLPIIDDTDALVVEAGLEAGTEWFALSFVQSAADVEVLRSMVGADTWVMSKIERPLAVRDLESIASVSDAVLVARGDLGVELPFEEVPLVQRDVLDRARALGVPAVCATEMLESMIHQSRPTRAEATDVSSAVFDAFDALMLSAETAVGHDPLGAVRAMDRIRTSVESSPRFSRRLAHMNSFQEFDLPRAAVPSAAVRLAESVDAAAIISLTASGFTARLIAACRPSVPVLAVTPSDRTASQMNLLWGVTPLVVSRPESTDEAARKACRAALLLGHVAAGDRVVVCGSRVGPTSDADAIWVQTL
jgi:pyruvate kinase